MASSRPRPSLAVPAALLALLSACRTAPLHPSLPAGVPPEAAAAATSPTPSETAGAPAASAPDDLPPVRRVGDAVEVVSPAAALRVTLPAEDTVRLQLWPAGGARPAASFAVDPEVLGKPPPPFDVEVAGGEVTIRTAALALRVDRRSLAVTLLSPDGAKVAEQLGAAAWNGPGMGGRLAFRLFPGEHAYGLGDKARGLDRRGRSFDLWNYDAFGWKADTDPLYKSIPFLVLLRDGHAHGLFVDSAARAHVDVGEQRSERLSWEVERGAFDLYLFAGPDPKRVLGAYTALTGRTPLPPRWALGYHQSRYSYGSEAEVRALLARFRREALPLDAVWLDIEFQAGLAPFVVDRRRFPAFGRMVADLDAAGVRTVVITDPHVKVAPGREPYASGLAGDHFVHGEGGPFVGEVWPGRSAFPEFTLARTRAWWGGLYRRYVAQGVSGFWDDMNEPALFNARKSMPDGVLHRLEGGGTADHVAIHNAYGLLQARATSEGVLALRPQARPFVLTRAAYAGAQRWAATWTGDNRADREGLALTLPTLLNLGASGYAFAGADVGGFFGCPDAALLTEWTELGVFQPFFRNHSSKDSCRREPWVNGPEHERRRRAAVERRYRLLPYLYTAFEEASRTGLPVMRPLWLEHPADPSTWDADRAFLLGADLLVAPKLLEGEAPYPVALPAGEWFETRSGERFPGGRAVVAPPPEDSVRVFARAGAIVPEGPVPAHAAEPPRGPLTVHVWPGPDCRGALYLDAGEGFGYRVGQLRRVAFRCQAGPDGIAVTAASEGVYPAWWNATEVVLHGVPRPPIAAVDAAGAPLTWRYDPAVHAATVTLPGVAAEWSLSARW